MATDPWYASLGRLPATARSTAHVTGRLLGAAAAALGLFVVFTVVLMAWQGMTITNPRLYEIVLNHRWLDTDQIAHFPESIPSSAEDVVFYFIGGFLQGGSVIELRMGLPAEAIDELERVYRPRAIGVFDAAGNPAADRGAVAVLPKPYFQTLPAELQWIRRTTLPESFETLVLKASTPVNLNHPKASGVTIDRARHEVIFWAVYG